MRKAFTLIEVLLAISIAALVAGLVFSLYHMAAGILGDREDRKRAETSAVRALQQLSRDLAGSLHADMYEACDFELSVADHPVSGSARLSLCTTVMPYPEDDLRWHEVHHVVYQMEISGPDNHRLIRVHQPLAGPGALSYAVTNSLLDQVDHFKVTILHEEEWHSEWSAESPEDWPKAARIILQAEMPYGKSREFRTEVLIPAGMQIEADEDRDAVMGSE